MTDHAYDVVLLTSKVKATVASFGEAFGLALELGKKAQQRHFAGNKNPEIAVHRADVLVGCQCMRGRNAQCFLSKGAEPLGYLALTQVDQHFLFNGPSA